jgi:hypothetical protein
MRFDVDKDGENNNFMCTHTLHNHLAKGVAS